jgi:hypothetical protein
MLTCERVVHVLVEEFVARLGVSHMRGGVEAIQGCFMSEGDAQSISGGESKVPIGQLKVWVEWGLKPTCAVADACRAPESGKCRLVRGRVEKL